MAANNLVLTITSINANAAEDNIDNIVIGVTGRVNTAVLDNTMIKVLRSHNAGAFSDVSSTTDLINSATASAATIDLTKITGHDTTDIYLIQVIENYSSVDYISDRVSVDLATTFDSTHTSTVSYELPAQPGNYKMAIAKVNGETFDVVNATAFPVGPKPDTANSSISIKPATKPYLVAYPGQKAIVTIVLNNAAGDAAQGDYEIVYQAKKQ